MRRRGKKKKDKNPAKRNGGLSGKSEGRSWGRETERKKRVERNAETQSDPGTWDGRRQMDEGRERGGGLEGH